MLTDLALPVTDTETALLPGTILNSEECTILPDINIDYPLPPPAPALFQEGERAVEALDVPAENIVFAPNDSGVVAVVNKNSLSVTCFIDGHAPITIKDTTIQDGKINIHQAVRIENQVVLVGNAYIYVYDIDTKRLKKIKKSIASCSSRKYFYNPTDGIFYTDDDETPAKIAGKDVVKFSTDAINYNTIQVNEYIYFIDPDKLFRCFNRACELVVEDSDAIFASIARYENYLIIGTKTNPYLYAWDLDTHQLKKIPILFSDSQAVPIMIQILPVEEGIIVLDWQYDKYYYLSGDIHHTELIQNGAQEAGTVSSFNHFMDTRNGCFLYKLNSGYARVTVPKGMSCEDCGWGHEFCEWVRANKKTE